MHSAWNFLQVNARLSKPSGMALMIMLSRSSFDIRERAIGVFVEWRDADEEGNPSSTGRQSHGGTRGGKDDGMGIAKLPAA